MDGHNEPQLPAPPSRRALGRSSSFSHRSSIPPPPPLSISRPLILPPPPAHDPPSSPSLIEEHLFLGSHLSARDISSLRSLRISHVLSCVGGPHPFRPELLYKTLWLSDSPSQDITSVLFDAFDLLELVRLSRRRVLVHCSRGVSRSAALVVAYLMWRYSIPFDAALRRVRSARPAADPNLGFASQLLAFQSRIIPPPDSTDFPARLYRMAPHSAYDPLHLVPKAVDRPSRCDLDPRGAFVMHASRGVFVWIGSSCSSGMARAAGHAASQVLRYERAKGPVVTVGEGREGAEFWRELGDGEGECRRVTAYDLDFEMFARAVKGGVVPEFGGEEEAAWVLPVKEGAWGVGEVDERDMEPFGSPQSVFSRDPGTPSSSDLSSLSPASSLSDWCNSSSPSSELFYDGEMMLGAAATPTSPGHHFSDRGYEQDKDVHFPTVRMVVDGEEQAMCAGSPEGVGRLCSDEDDPSMEPALFRWPGFEQLKDLHPGVLNSHSVLVLVAPELCTQKSRSRILYVWAGGKSTLVEGSSSAECENKSNIEEALRKVGCEFLDQMNYPDDIPVQVVREDEEPEGFLNHLFSFHQAKDAILK